MIRLLLIAFIFGSFISALDSEIFNESIRILPNYFYWIFCVILFTEYRNYILESNIAKYMFIGILCTTISFIFRDQIPDLTFINKPSRNTFAFLCVCFTSPSIAYLYNKKKYRFLSILLFLMIILTLLSTGRRAGFVIVLSTTLFMIFFRKINFLNLLKIFFISILFLFFLNNSTVKNYVNKTSPRVHNIIYDFQNVLSIDRSYAMRILMIQKAKKIYFANPLTGVGLGNFTKTFVYLQSDFEGSEYVINKKNVQSISAHNSYYAILAEGGLLMFIPFISVIIFNLYFFLKFYNKRNMIENSFYWSLIATLIHLYYISAIFNIYAWLTIAITTSLNMREIKKKNFNSIL